MTSPSPTGIPCPWVWIVGDLGEQLIFTVNWDTATSEIMSAVVFRDIDCIYENIFLGGIPYPVDVGETLIRYRDFPETADYHYIADIVYAPISVGFTQNINLVAATSLRVA